MALFLFLGGLLVAVGLAVQAGFAASLGTVAEIAAVVMVGWVVVECARAFGHRGGTVVREGVPGAAGGGWEGDDWLAECLRKDVAASASYAGMSIENPEMYILGEIDRGNHPAEDFGCGETGEESVFSSDF